MVQTTPEIVALLSSLHRRQGECCLMIANIAAGYRHVWWIFNLVSEYLCLDGIPLPKRWPKVSQHLDLRGFQRFPCEHVTWQSTHWIVTYLENHTTVVHSMAGKLLQSARRKWENHQIGHGFQLLNDRSSPWLEWLVLSPWNEGL